MPDIHDLIQMILAMAWPVTPMLAYLIARCPFVGQPPLWRVRRPYRASAVLAFVLITSQQLAIHDMVLDNYFDGFFGFFRFYRGEPMSLVLSGLHQIWALEYKRSLIFASHFPLSIYLIWLGSRIGRSMAAREMEQGAPDDTP